MDKNNTFNKNGFSLIELIIAISIITLFSAMSLSVYNQYTSQQQLIKQQNNLINLLELSRKKATSSDLNNYSCPVNTDFTGYQINITSNSLTMFICCGSGNNCSNRYQITQYSIESPITITNGIGNFRFKNSGQTNLTSPLTITLKQNSLSKCLNIYISPMGLIDYDNTLFSC
jgi:prepilin-type N-terminal cleavage/methylation domain-containing protein